MIQKRITRKGERNSMKQAMNVSLSFSSSIWDIVCHVWQTNDEMNDETIAGWSKIIYDASGFKTV